MTICMSSPLWILALSISKTDPVGSGKLRKKAQILLCDPSLSGGFAHATKKCSNTKAFYFFVLPQQSLVSVFGVHQDHRNTWSRNSGLLVPVPKDNYLSTTSL